jgi:hypothetical protein
MASSKPVGVHGYAPIYDTLAIQHTCGNTATPVAATQYKTRSSSSATMRRHAAARQTIGDKISSAEFLCKDSWHSYFLKNCSAAAATEAGSSTVQQTILPATARSSPTTKDMLQLATWRQVG